MDGRSAAQVVVTGGPVGKTKKTGKDGVTDIRNKVAAYVVVQAESHEAAASMFENHPHFAIFPRGLGGGHGSRCRSRGRAGLSA